jgi:hypothetical protein
MPPRLVNGKLGYSDYQGIWCFPITVFSDKYDSRTLLMRSTARSQYRNLATFPRYPSKAPAFLGYVKHSLASGSV